MDNWRRLMLLVVLSSPSCVSDAPPSSGSVPRRPSSRIEPHQAASAPSFHWPPDPMKSQLGDLSTLEASVPSCGSAAIVTADSVGVLRPGYPLSRVAALCPRALPLWDLGDEAIPAPVLIVQLGPTRFELLFEDTLPASPLVSIVGRDSTARTLAGVGPGSLFTALTAAYGKPLLEEGECVLHVAFASQPGLSFRLDMHKQVDCEAIPGIVTRNDVARLPTNTRVKEVTVYRRAPAT